MRRLMAAFVLLACVAAAEPVRIVSTAPSITEMLYALGLGARVVGVTAYCRYPVDAQSKPKVGTFLQPDFERILALKPDLVLVIKNPVQLAGRLRKLGVRAEELNQDSIEDIFGSLAALGRLTGRQAQAIELTGEIRAQLDAVRRQASGQRKRTALFLVGRAPGTLQGMVGAGPGTFIDELMTLAGGENILKGSPIQYPRVSLEQVLAGDPEVILDMGDFAHAEGKPMEPESRLLALWGAHPQLRAVKTRQVKQVGSEIFIRPGPRMGEAARELRRLLGGDGGR
ncbi:MAG: ABC transporter substrate-binding protein [Acidobacteria bacterium]|nr:ABC transporter substrate-binding protein [Acidobacteriota bacterium]